MATTTDNIGLIKPTYNEALDIDDINDNSDVIDEQIQALKDVITNAKALLGQLGVDSNGDPLVSAASARATLDAAQSESATGSLHDSEQAISDIVASTGSVKKSNGSYVPLQSQISTLQDSVALRLGAKIAYSGSSTGRYVIFDVVPKFVAGRVPILLVCGHQSDDKGFSTVLTISHDGAMAGNAYATKTGNTVTVDAGINAWSNTMIVYDPELFTIS